MEGEALANRPESPKKKIKSNPISDSEAQPSNSSESNMNVANNEGHGNNLLNGVAPTRKRIFVPKPDSSSESCSREHIESSPPRVQEEEVSSSENTVGKVKEPDDVTIVCDSASSELSDKH